MKQVDNYFWPIREQILVFRPSHPAWPQVRWQFVGENVDRVADLIHNETFHWLYSSPELAAMAHVDRR